MQIIHFIRQLLRRRVQLAIVPVLAGALTYWMASNQPPSYESTASIQINLSSVGESLLNGGGSRALGNFEVRNAIADAMSLLESSQVHEAAGWLILRAHIEGVSAGGEPLTAHLSDGQAVPNRFPEIIAAWAVEGGFDAGEVEAELPGLIRQESADAAIPLAQGASTLSFLDWVANGKSPYSGTTISGGLSVKRIPDSSVIEMSYGSQHPDEVALVLAFVLDAFGVIYQEVKDSEVSNARAFFERQVEEGRTRLEEREIELKAFRTENQISNFYEQTKALSFHVTDVRLLVREARKVGAEAGAQMSQIEIELGQDGALLALARESIESDAKVLDLTQSLAREHAARNIEQILNGGEVPANGFEAIPAEENLNDAIEDHFKERVTGLGSHKSQLVLEWLMKRLEHEAALAGTAELEDYLNVLLTENARFAKLGSEVSRLEREIDVSEREYLSLLHSLNMARLKEQQSTDARGHNIIDPVSMPTRPTASSPVVAAAMAAVGAEGLVVGVLLLAVMMDRSLFLPDEFERALAIPVWGGVPIVAGIAERPNDLDRRQKTIFGRLSGGVVASLVSNFPPTHPVVLQIVGTRPGCGKSTITRLLADGLEGLGYTAELLSLVSEGEGEADESPSAMLLSVKQRLQTSEAQYVIIDTPDLSRSTLAVDMGLSVDASLLVFSSGTTNGPADDRFIKSLKLSGAPIAGLVINQLGYDAAEQLLGDVPMPRSAVRRMVKRIVMRNLFIQDGSLPDAAGGGKKAKKAKKE